SQARRSSGPGQRRRAAVMAAPPRAIIPDPGPHIERFHPVHTVAVHSRTDAPPEATPRRGQRPWPAGRSALGNQPPADLASGRSPRELSHTLAAGVRRADNTPRPDGPPCDREVPSRRRSMLRSRLPLLSALCLLAGLAAPARPEDQPAKAGI